MNKCIFETTLGNMKKCLNALDELKGKELTPQQQRACYFLIEACNKIAQCYLIADENQPQEAKE